VKNTDTKFKRKNVNNFCNSSRYVKKILSLNCHIALDLLYKSSGGGILQFLKGKEIFEEKWEILKKDGFICPPPLNLNRIFSAYTIRPEII